jgi:di/tricarboxylate transporter
MKDKFKELWGKGPIIERQVAMTLLALFLYAPTSSASTATLIAPITINGDSNSTHCIFAAVELTTLLFQSATLRGACNASQ